MSEKRPKDRKPNPGRAGHEKPYDRRVFTDGSAPAPAVVAVDAQPRAGDITFHGGVTIRAIVTDPAGLSTSVRAPNHRKTSR